MKKLIMAIKPTEFSITLGNYLGCLLPTIKLQETSELIVFVADLHALTIYQDPAKLKQNIENLTATYLAAGLDINKCKIFRQSDIPAHNQLEWVLTCNTKLSDLTKMPQYKDYLEKNTNKSIKAGILNYPTLMSSDILLYDVDGVIVGQDQLPHIYLAKLQAETFNNLYGKTFKVPEAISTATGAKIMSLTDPTKKMSKSNQEGCIYLLEDIAIARKKIMKALTDSEDKVYYNPETKPGISNLMTIYSALTNKSFEEIADEFKNTTNYGVFKKAVADVVCNELLTLQNRIKMYKDPKFNFNISAMLEQAAEKINVIANTKLDKVYKKIGLR